VKLWSKRALKRIAITFGLLVGTALVINGVLAWRAQHRLDAIVAKLRAAGEPASLADIRPKPIPPEKNAAVHLQRISKDLNEFEKEYEKFYQTPLGEELDKRSESVPGIGWAQPNAEQLTAIRSIVDAHPQILHALQEAAACGEYGSVLDFSPPPSQFLERVMKDCTKPRELARYVAWKMATLMADGESDEAIRLGVQMLRLTRLWNHEPLLINSLVGVAIRGIMFESINVALRQGQHSTELLHALDVELALHDSLKPLALALCTERAFSIPYVQEQTGVVSAFVRWPMLNFFLGELSVEDEAYAIAKLPLNQMHLKWDPTNKVSTPTELIGLQSRLTGPAIVAAFSSHFRCLTQARCLRVFNALEEYHQRTGRDADSVSQLSLPRESAIDPYSEKPLLLKKTDRGWIVYSVGMKGIDNGGKLESQGNEGFAPPDYRQD
jgi:hypothetical protein